MTANVSIRNVSKDFGACRALDDVSLEIAAGEFIVLLGPSGCGKTTLLSILGGFLAPGAGAIAIGGRDMTHVPPAGRPTTTMFQDYALFPHMRLIDNVGFGLRMRGMGKAARDKKAQFYLELVGLGAAAKNKPHQLSGGQRQRVALARALAVDPDVLLLDEPLGALDLRLRRQMQDELKSIQQRVGTTFIHVTHDQEEAMAIADRIVVMNRGRIEDSGAPARIYMQPRSRFSATFMGEVNLLPGAVHRVAQQVEIETGLGRLTLPAGLFAGDAPSRGERVTLCIRPEHFRLHDDAGPIISLGAARVTDITFFGTHHRCQLAAGDIALTAHLPPTASPQAGSTFTLRLQAHSIAVLRDGATEGGE